eukprot:3600853-Rhodomonas_salina.1
MTSVLSYDVGAVRSSNVEDRDGGRVGLSGSSLGHVSSTAGVRGGGTVCEGTDWVSDTLVRCAIAVGEKASLGIAVTSGSFPGSMSEAVSYDRVTRVLRRANVGMFGGQSLTVAWDVGLRPRYSSAGRVGETGHESTVWVSESSTTCRAAGGTGGSLKDVLTVGVVVGSWTEGISYGGPEVLRLISVNISAAPRANVAATGGGSLMVSGLSFGTKDVSGQLRVGVSGCSSSEWISTTSMAGLYARGLCGGWALVVSGSSKVGSATHMLSYNNAEVRGSLNVPAGGAVRLMVSGPDLGPVASSVQARVGDTACEETVWTSGSSLQCKAGLNGGGSLSAAATVCLVARTFTESVTFDFPSVFLGASRGNLAVNGPSAVMLQGTAMGASDYTARVAGGGTSCEQTDWISETSVGCKPARGCSGTVAA